MRGFLKRFLPAREDRTSGISIICAFNNQDILEEYLLRSLAGQTLPHELLTIDTRGGGHSCAARLLNEAAKQATHEYLMFVHQDVALDSKDWLAKTARDLDALPRLGVAGVAGSRLFRFVASVSHGVPPRFIGPERLKRPVQVQTVDGCLMLVRREQFTMVPFDADTVDGWYLYVLEYCLTMKRLGRRNYVLPHHVIHQSEGPRDHSVFQGAVEKIRAKHRDHIRTIYSTIGKWKT